MFPLMSSPLISGAQLGILRRCRGLVNTVFLHGLYPIWFVGSKRRRLDGSKKGKGETIVHLMILQPSIEFFHSKRYQHDASSTDSRSNRETKVVVVGGGAAGIELSLAMRARWDNISTIPKNGDESPRKSHLSITLLDSNDELMPGESIACRTALNHIMEKYRIEVRHNLIVREVTSARVRVSSRSEDGNDSTWNEEIPYTHCIWATGAQGMSRAFGPFQNSHQKTQPHSQAISPHHPHAQPQAHELSRKLHKQCGLAVSKDRGGWIVVNPHLQSISHPYIFAAGDCCEMVRGKSPPKAGVYAVRSGPVLIKNLVRALNGEDGGNRSELARYTPQDDFLKLLMCGDGTALGFRFGIPLVSASISSLIRDTLGVSQRYFFSSTASGFGI